MRRTDSVTHVRRDPAPGAGAPSSRVLSPRRRKLVLAAHIVISVGLLGIYAAMLILGTVAARTPDPETTSAAYRSMGILRAVIPPAAGGVLVTGLILALGTTWGLFKHYWVVVKLALTLVALPVTILGVFPALQRAIAATARAAPLTAVAPGSAPLLLIAACGTIVLLLGAATVIGVYKPWGMIARQRRSWREPLPEAAP